MLSGRAMQPTRRCVPFLACAWLFAGCASTPTAPSTPTAQSGDTTSPPVVGASPASSSPTATPGPGPSPARAAGHRRCGWIGGGDSAGADAFVAHADWYDAIHPDWYALDGDGVSLRPVSGDDGAALVSAARAHGVKLIPLVTAVEDIGPLRATLADPQRRVRHAQALADLAVTHGYDGLDLDYEKLWDAADRAGYTALIEEAASRLHAAGKQLSIAVPGLPDRKMLNGYDLEALVAVVDHIHVMGYDFHTVGTHGGPLAPLGWLEAVLARADATGAPEKFILGLPNYGVTTSWFTTLGDALRLCGASYSTVDDHMASCDYGHYAAGRTPHCSTAHGELYFEDLGSLEDKLKLAARYKLAGVGYWTVGSEPDGFRALVGKYF